MRKFIAGLAAGAVMASAGVGVAASYWTKDYAGILCQGKQGNIICLKQNVTGYSVGISRDQVAVFDVKTSKMIYRKSH